jgi:hypothetical protein
MFANKKKRTEVGEVLLGERQVVPPEDDIGDDGGDDGGG